MDEKLRTIASENGYTEALCSFLDNLEQGGKLAGEGASTVAEAIILHLNEIDVIKVALANIGRILSDCDLNLNSELQSRNEYSINEWIAIGNELFSKHLTEEGIFKFDDFAPTDCNNSMGKGLFG